MQTRKKLFIVPKILIILQIFFTLSNLAIIPVTNAASPLPVTSVVKIYSGNVQFGSGFVVDAAKGYILTNAHVVLHEHTFRSFDQYTICTITSAEQEAQCDFTAKLLYADVDKDLALLQVDQQNQNNSTSTLQLPAIDILNIKSAQIGDNIDVLGFPSLGGNTITASKGTVSGFKTFTGYNNLTLSVLKTDANVTGGVSGGLVVDENGDFAGIPSSYITDENSNKIGIIITADEVKNWFNSIGGQLAGSQPIIKTILPANVSGINLKKVSNTSVEISWDKPISNSPIDYFYLSYDTQPIGGREFATQEDFPNYTKLPGSKLIYTVNNLKPGAIYYFEMAAFNTQKYYSHNWTYDSTINMITGKMDDRIFTDVGIDHQNALALNYLKMTDTISGYDDGSFRPSNTINRAELIKMIVIANGSSFQKDQYSSCFSDVKNEWFAPYVCYAKEQKWIEGYAENIFKPSQEVNMAESLKIILQAYDMPIGKVAPDSNFPVELTNQWFTPYVLLAANLRILPEAASNVNMNEKVSRGKIAEILYRTTLLQYDKSTVSPTLWRDSDNKIVDVKSYLGLNNHTLRYVQTTSGQKSEKEITVRQGCKISLNVGCYTITELEGDSAQVELVGNAVALLRGDGPAYKKPILPTEPAIYFAQTNQLLYVKYKYPILIQNKQQGFTMKVTDGKTVFKFVDNEKVKVPAGEFDAIKTVTKMSRFCQVEVGETTVPMEIIVEVTDYWVKGIGSVKQSMAVSIYNLRTGDSKDLGTIDLELQEMPTN